MKTAIAVCALVSVLASASSLQAQTCTVSPASSPTPATCTASAQAGSAFSGAVLQVIDGRTLCVALGPSPSQWVRVRITDAELGSARGALMAAAFGKTVTCLATGSDGDGVLGMCFVGGVSIGSSARDPEYRAQAADWR